MRNVALSLLVWLVCFCPLGAQMTITVTDVPDLYTPLFDDIYVAGDFNNWQAGDPNYRLTLQPNGDYIISLNGVNGTPMEFKFTRGNWDAVETTANGGFLANRTATFQNGQTLQLSIADWDDTNGNHTATGNLFILDSDMLMPQLTRNRRIWIWLPDDYFQNNDTHPVLYVHDGQNIFDASTSFSGEWELDETMSAIEASGFPSAIVVGIDNGGATRLDEYSPWVNPSYGGGEGDEYMTFIVQTLKPFIDQHFRTQPQREATALLGSSMGGLISYYGGMVYQQTFSKIGVFSPAFWFSNSVNSVAQQNGHQAPMRLYFISGTTESASMVPNMQNVYNTLLANGFSASELNLQTRVDGAHSEWFWAREFEDAYRWLFANLLLAEETPTVAPSAPPGFKAYQDGDMLRFQYPENEKVVGLQLFSANGIMLLSGNTFWSAWDIGDLSTGLYFMTFYTPTSHYKVPVQIIGTK